MPVATPDLEQGHGLSEVLGAVEIRRVWFVTELTAAPEGQLLEAVRDPAVPKLGQGYPGEPQWFVVRIEAEPGRHENSARIVYTYSNRQGPTWNQSPPVSNEGEDVKQFSGSTKRQLTTRDRGNTPMTLSPPAAYAGWDDYESEAELSTPVGELVFERTEASNPADKWRVHGGTVNVGAIGAYGAETLLFSRLDAQSDDGGRVWRCTYRFAFDPQQWAHVDVYHAPDGKVPVGALPVAFNVQPTSDFSALGLDFSDNQSPI